MGAFETIGTTLESDISSYAEQISGSLITNLSPILLSCVTLYFILKGWMFLTGRADGAIADTVITTFKIAIVAMVGLNSGNFVSLGIGFINGAEELLMSSLPSGSSSGWEAIDNLWSIIGKGVKAMCQMLGKFGVTEIGYSFLLVILMIVFFIAGSFLTLAALGVFIIAKLSLVIVMGFGPLFICALMFPVTRLWFDGWLKSCMTAVFTIVLMAGVIGLVTHIFNDRIDQLSSVLSKDLNKGSIAEISIGLFTFVISCVALGALVKAVPGMASGVTGGMSLGAVSLASMVRDTARGTKNTVQGITHTGKAIAHGVATSIKPITSGAKAIGNSVGSDLKLLGNASVRAGRAIKAAYLSYARR